MSSSKDKRVEPRLAKGTTDLDPVRARARQGIVEIIAEVYEGYGFMPLSTPAIERWETLVGRAGREAHQTIFRVESPEEEELGLRFDLTVPLSRFVAANQQQLPRPFKRWQIAPVWRQDKPGPGRFREFVQCDADILGTTNPLADDEVVAALRDVFARVMPPDETGSRFQVRMSDRRILNTLLTRAGLQQDQGPEVFRVLDKLDRLGLEKVRAELTTGYQDESGAEIPGLGIADAAVETIAGFLAIGQEGSPSRRSVLEALAAFFGDTAGAEETIEAVGSFCSLLDGLGVSDAEAALDPSIARGLAYYTGPVFEVGLRDLPSVGSVASGGRYDDLVSRFSGTAWPGVGVSVGLDRLIAALTELGQLPAGGAPGAEVFVSVMDPSRLDHALELAADLRAAGVRAEVWTGSSKNFGKQMKHADKLGVSLALIAGGDEIKKGVVTVKRMEAAGALDTTALSRDEWLDERAGQAEVPRDQLVASVLAALGRGAR
jgi:histidyl-tRNA synthetase